MKQGTVHLSPQLQNDQYNPECKHPRHCTEKEKIKTFMLSMRDEIQKYHDRKHAENSQQKSHPIEEMESTYPAHTKNKGEPVYQHNLHKKEGQDDQTQLQPIDHRFPKS
jgi:hypothetical protein